jgi:DNA primase
MNQPMGRENDWERVKAATDIVRLVGEHVKLKAKGREYVGLCPFHDDHTPSMCVVPAKGIFHCFVCNAGGDCFAFTSRMFRMERHEALKHLAERANIELTPWKPNRGGGVAEEIPTGPSRRDVLDACGFASEFFKTLLRHPEHGAAGRAVIERRGISPEMVEQFGLGVSAARWDGLLLTLKSKGIPEQASIEAGLLKKRDGGDGCYDAFRNRLMFPILDAAGRVIAFGGRKIDEADEPKYINSPETRLFSKSQTLYGLFQASQEIRRLNEVVVTEGYTDTIACHQSGVRHVVAALGTALTREHAALLSRYCTRVVLLFDGDEAGQRAADKAVEVFFAEPVDVSICTLKDHTDAKDPDELLKREGGVEVLRKAFASSTDLLAYRFGRIKAKLSGAGVSALSRALSEEIGRLKELGLGEVEPIKQRLVVKHLASLSGLDEATIRDQIGLDLTTRRVPRAAPAPAPEEARARAEDELHRLGSGRWTPAEALLGCLLADGDLIHALPREQHDLIAPSAYSSPLVAKIAEAVALVCDGGKPPSLDAVLDELRGDAESSQGGEFPESAATTLCRRTERQADQDPARIRQSFDECLRRAMLDHAAGGGSSGETPRVMDSAERLDHARRSQNTGGDRRRLPKFR